MLHAFGGRGVRHLKPQKFSSLSMHTQGNREPMNRRLNSKLRAMVKENSLVIDYTPEIQSAKHGEYTSESQSTK